MGAIVAYILFLAVNLVPKDADRITFNFFDQLTWVKQDKTTWFLYETHTGENSNGGKPQGAWTVKGTVVTFPNEGRLATFDVSVFLVVPSPVDWEIVSEIAVKKTPDNPIRITRTDGRVTLSQGKRSGPGTVLFPTPITIIWEKTKK